ncbi:cytochrome P450 family protein [Dactylosporangium cerinum]
MTMVSTSDRSVGGIDLADPAFWRQPEPARHAAFARLRRLDAPVFFPEPGGGFFALVRHADVVTASRTPDVFVSRHGVTTPRPARWVRTVFGDSMVNLDDPRHQQLRSIVARAFTPASWPGSPPTPSGSPPASSTTWSWRAAGRVAGRATS